jgi:hypothetical protein
VRDFTAGSDARFGSHVIRRRFTNNTGGPISRLRFRVVDLLTFPTSDGEADLRARTIGDATVATSGGDVLVRGTTLEQPPNQTLSGGINSSLAVPSVDAANPLAAGATIAIQFAFGLEEMGDVRLALNAEALVLGPGTNGPGNGAPVTDAGDAPAAPSTPDLDPSSDSGISNSDNRTNDNTPTFNGTAAPNTTVQIFSSLGGGFVLRATGVANASGLYSITVPAGNPLPDGGHVTMAAATVDNINGPPSFLTSVLIDTASPVVDRVVVAGTAWTANFLTFLQTSGLGDGTGFTVPAGADQLLNLPWINTSLIKLRFTEDVAIQQNDLSVRGVNAPSYAVSSLVYDAPTRTATWTLQAGIPAADKLLLDLNGTAAGLVVDPAGNALDGNWVDGADAYPSGDGSPGGDFEFRLNILPGDASGNGVVDVSDLGALATNFNQSPRGPRDGEFTGDGMVDVSDLGVLATNFNRSLPAGNPALVAPPRLTIRPARALFGERAIPRPRALDTLFD